MRRSSRASRSRTPSGRRLGDSRPLQPRRRPWSSARRMHRKPRCWETPGHRVPLRSRGCGAGRIAPTGRTTAETLRQRLLESRGRSTIARRRRLRRRLTLRHPRMIRVVRSLPHRLRPATRARPLLPARPNPAARLLLHRHRRSQIRRRPPPSRPHPSRPRHPRLFPLRRPPRRPNLPPRLLTNPPFRHRRHHLLHRHLLRLRPTRRPASPPAEARASSRTRAASRWAAGRARSLPDRPLRPGRASRSPFRTTTRVCSR
jgi:hypothetical protein